MLSQMNFATSGNSEGLVYHQLVPDKPKMVVFVNLFGKNNKTLGLTVNVDFI